MSHKNIEAENNSKEFLFQVSRCHSSSLRHLSLVCSLQKNSFSLTSLQLTFDGRENAREMSATNRHDNVRRKTFVFHRDNEWKWESGGQLRKTTWGWSFPSFSSVVESRKHGKAPKWGVSNELRMSYLTLPWSLLGHLFPDVLKFLTSSLASSSSLDAIFSPNRRSLRLSLFLTVEGREIVSCLDSFLSFPSLHRHNHHHLYRLYTACWSPPLSGKSLSLIDDTNFCHISLPGIEACEGCKWLLLWRWCFSSVAYSFENCMGREFVSPSRVPKS